MDEVAMPRRLRSATTSLNSPPEPSTRAAGLQTVPASAGLPRPLVDSVDTNIVTATAARAVATERNGITID
jgi:hypothetical protein